MPAQYTHQILAERILGALPENVREKIIDQTAYFIGAQGGDVFYFLRVFDGKTENLGKYMHNEEISSFFNSLCARASEGGTALSYALGYVTHYAVDIVFHPYVYGQTEFFIGQHPSRRVRWHAYIESDIDSYFVQKHLGIPVNQYVYPVRKKELDARALYALIRGVCHDRGRKNFSYPSFLRSLSRFYLFERLFRDRKLRKRKFLNAGENLFRASHTLSVLCRRTDFDGQCLNTEHREWHNPSEPAFLSREDADLLFERAAAEGVRLVSEFFICMQAGAELPASDFGKGFLSGIDEHIPLVRPKRPQNGKKKRQADHSVAADSETQKK